MAQYIDVPLAQLLLDQKNARLIDEQPNQPAAILAIAKQQKKKLVRLARDIVERSALDPLSLPGVVPFGDGKRYVVLEGNRRVVALKGLETPSLVLAALDPKEQAEFNALAQQFAQDPITDVHCYLFDTEADGLPWVKLRHTGANDGAGLVPWGTDEQDRFNARHGSRSYAGQIIDFVAASGLTHIPAGTKISTNLTRLFNDREVRDRLGIDFSGGQILTRYPRAETAKVLARVVEDFVTKRAKVGDIYHKSDRAKYLKKIPKEFLPDPSTQLAAPTSLDGAVDVDPPPTRARRTGTRRRVRDRSTIVGVGVNLNITVKRIEYIYGELRSLPVPPYANAGAVLFRVFTELSVDHFLETYHVMSEHDRRNKPLVKRIKETTAAMVKASMISGQLKDVVDGVADASGGVLMASIPTFNQYVHNKYAFPKPDHLKLAWDELEPFFAALWP